MGSVVSFAALCTARKTHPHQVRGSNMACSLCKVSFSFGLLGFCLPGLGLASLLLSAGAEQVFTGLRALPAVSNSQQLAELPESLAADADNIMTVHLMSSCPMGENRRMTAVNSWGRVHGYTGLYVADVSTLCSSPGVNPQGTIMALAKRSSDHFLKV